jgi:hypothetical protein
MNARASRKDEAAMKMNDTKVKKVTESGVGIYRPQTVRISEIVGLR